MSIHCHIWIRWRPRKSKFTFRSINKLSTVPLYPIVVVVVVIIIIIIYLFIYLSISIRLWYGYSTLRRFNIDLLSFFLGWSYDLNTADGKF